MSFFLNFFLYFFISRLPSSISFFFSICLSSFLCLFVSLPFFLSLSPSFLPPFLPSLSSFLAILTATYEEGDDDSHRTYEEAEEGPDHGVDDGTVVLHLTHHHLRGFVRVIKARVFLAWLSVLLVKPPYILLTLEVVQRANRVEGTRLKKRGRNVP